MIVEVFFVVSWAVQLDARKASKRATANMGFEILMALVSGFGLSIMSKNQDTPAGCQGILYLNLNL